MRNGPVKHQQNWTFLLLLVVGLVVLGQIIQDQAGVAEQVDTGHL
jgi:hypothetical protein